MTNLELARRAVACKRWRWVEGMRLIPDDPIGYGRVADDGRTCIHGGKVDLRICPGDLPDLRDPATLGCLLALVREVWEPHRNGDPVFSACMVNGKWGVGVWIERVFAAAVLPACDTEAEALVAALEAAP